MMGDLTSYLIKQFIDIEMDGLQNKADNMVDRFFTRVQSEKDKAVEHFMTEFFTRFETAKESMIKQMTQMSLFVIGAAFTGLGIAYIIDRLTNFPGVGFALMGILMLIGGMLIKR